MSEMVTDNRFIGVGEPHGDHFTRKGKALVCKNPATSDLRGTIQESVDAIGGFSKIIDKGDEILVKPNFNTADPPPASSDPEFVQAVVDLLLEHGAGKVVIGESSTFSACTRKVFEETGMMEKTSGAKTVFFEEEKHRKVQTGGRYLKKVSLPEPVLGARKLVNVCCMKTHQYATFTFSLKNAVGFMKRSERLISLHTWKLEEKIADLNLVIHPILNIMDGRRCFISGGPSCGELREPGIVLASGDRVALDVEAVKVIRGYDGASLKRDPWEYTQIERAVNLGLGVEKEDEYEVVAI